MVERNNGEMSNGNYRSDVEESEASRPGTGRSQEHDNKVGDGHYFSSDKQKLLLPTESQVSGSDNST